MRSAFLAFLISGGTQWVAAQDVQFAAVEAAIVVGRLDRLQLQNADRANELRQMFAEAGCSGMFLSDQRVKGSKLPNLLCTLPGASGKCIVVTAHYDKVKEGEGAVDNWSGASMLSSLFESLSTIPRNLTFVFIATTDEEKGLVGAQEYWRQLSKEDRRNVVANVNVDTVGLKDAIYVWGQRADRKLLNATATIANALQIPVKGVNIIEGGDTDSHVFLNNRIAVIDFHSLEPKDFATLHSKQDVRAVVDSATYFSTYRLVSGVLALLDAQASLPAEAQSNSGDNR